MLTKLICKDIKRRCKAQSKDFSRQLFKFVSNNEQIDSTLKKNMMIKQYELKKNGKTKVVNRCALSGRPRGVHRWTKMSRLAMKFYIGEGLLNGFRKSSW